MAKNANHHPIDLKNYIQQSHTVTWTELLSSHFWPETSREKHANFTSKKPSSVNLTMYRHVGVCITCIPEVTAWKSAHKLLFWTDFGWPPKMANTVKYSSTVRDLNFVLGHQNWKKMAKNYVPKSYFTSTDQRNNIFYKTYKKQGSKNITEIQEFSPM